MGFHHDDERSSSEREVVATWVEAYFCDPPPAEERGLLGRILRPSEREGCVLAPHLPPRRWDRGLVLLRLRLHEEAGRETAQPEPNFFLSGCSRTLPLPLGLYLLLVRFGLRLREKFKRIYIS